MSFDQLGLSAELLRSHCRGRSEGHAVSLVSPEESKQLKAIKRLLGRTFTCEIAPGHERFTFRYARLAFLQARA